MRGREQTSAERMTSRRTERAAAPLSPSPLSLMTRSGRGTQDMLGWVESDHLRLGTVVRHGAEEVLYRREASGAPRLACCATLTPCAAVGIRPIRLPPVRSTRLSIRRRAAAR